MNVEVPIPDHPLVLAAALFGSHARGDCDALSDIDVAVFADVEDVVQLRRVKSDLDVHCRDSGQTISLYSASTAEYMAYEGSLFLWHLRLEGKVLLDKKNWLSNLLKDLSPYGSSRALRDLEAFEQVLFDCGHSLLAQKDTVLFEVATACAVLRNLGIIHCFRRGIPCFGRTAPITKLATHMGKRFPFSTEQMLAFERVRLGYVRNPEQELPYFDAPSANDSVAGALQVLQFVRGDACG